VALLRSSAKRYGIPFDVALLSLVLIATFRAQEGVESDKRRRHTNDGAEDAPGSAEDKEGEEVDG